MTTSIPEYSECPWPVDTACFTEAWEDLDPPIQERSLALASATLRRLTAYRVGGCPVTVRPCKAACATGISYYAFGPNGWMNPHIGLSGTWINSCGCQTDCACEALCEIELPAPVGEIYAVKLNGSIVNPDNYRLDGNRLVWVGAEECPWPVCQDMSLDDDQPNTFSVTFLNSYPVDGMGAYAVAVLAMEFAKACTGGKCALPTGVTSVVRQGVSYNIASGAFPNGLTGLREVDAYIALWNPNRVREATQVWFPGKRAPRVIPTV